MDENQGTGREALGIIGWAVLLWAVFVVPLGLALLVGRWAGDRGTGFEGLGYFLYALLAGAAAGLGASLSVAKAARGRGAMAWWWWPLAAVGCAGLSVLMNRPWVGPSALALLVLAVALAASALAAHRAGMLTRGLALLMALGVAVGGVAAGHGEREHGLDESVASFERIGAHRLWMADEAVCRGTSAFPDGEQVQFSCSDPSDEIYTWTQRASTSQASQPRATGHDPVVVEFTTGEAAIRLEGYGDEASALAVARSLRPVPAEQVVRARGY